MAFSLECLEEGSIVVIVCHGYLDAEAGKSILTKVDENLSRGRLKFIFDLSDAPLVSSVVLGDLIDIVSKTLTLTELKICFCGLSNTVMTCFKSAGLNMYAEILTDKISAVNFLQKK